MKTHIAFLYALVWCAFFLGSPLSAQNLDTDSPNVLAIADSVAAHNYQAGPVDKIFWTIKKEAKNQRLQRLSSCHSAFSCLFPGDSIYIPQQIFGENIIGAAGWVVVHPVAFQSIWELSELLDKTGSFLSGQVFVENVIQFKSSEPF